MQILSLPHKKALSLKSRPQIFSKSCDLHCSIVTYFIVYSFSKLHLIFNDLFNLNNRIIIFFFFYFFKLIQFLFADTSIGYFSSEGSNRRLGEFCFWGIFNIFDLIQPFRIFQLFKINLVCIIQVS